MSVHRRRDPRPTLHAFGLALLACAGLQAPTAQAGGMVLCAANASQLVAALTMANPGGQDFDIRVRNGVYLSTPELFRLTAISGFTVSLSGGWNSSCQIQTLDPTLTVLDGNNQGAALLVSTPGAFAMPGTLNVSNLSITGGLGDSAPGGCMQVNAAAGSPTFVFDRLILRGCRNTGVTGHGGAVRIQNFTSAAITLRNSVIADNVAATGGGVAIASTHPNASTSLINNTIVNNTATLSGGAGGVSRIDTATIAGKIFVYNNIAFSNPGGSGSVLDIRLPFGAPADQLLFNNAVQSVGGSNYTGGGNITPASPGFVGPNNFNLRGDSLLRNAGLALSPILSGTRDLAANPRVQQDAIDIGAYEYAGVFQNGFE